MGLGLQWAWAPANIWVVLLQIALTFALYGVVVWFLVLTSEERDMVRRVFRRGDAAKAAEAKPRMEDGAQE